MTSAFGALVGFEAHVTVESDRLRILLVYGHLPYPEIAYPVLQLPPSKPRAALPERDEQHFQAAVWSRLRKNAA